MAMTSDRPISQSDRKDGNEFAKEFSSFMNVMSDDKRKAAIEEMLKDHPTLQQVGMKFFMMYVKGLAEKDYVDGRNEASQKLAKAIMALPDSTRALPFI